MDFGFDNVEENIAAEEAAEEQVRKLVREGPMVTGMEDVL